MIVSLANHEYRRDADGSVLISIYNDDGTDASLVSATVTLVKGGETLIDGATAAVSGNDVTYTISSTYLDGYYEDMVLYCDYVYSVSETDQSYHLISSSRTPLVNTVVTATLKKEYPLLDDDRWSSQTNYQIQINKAFKKVKEDVKDRAVEMQPGWLIDAEQLEQLVIDRSFMIIFRSFIKSPEDVFNLFYEEHKETYYRKIKAIRFRYDENDSGSIDRIKRLSTITMIR